LAPFADGRDQTVAVDDRTRHEHFHVAEPS
jgi:hypothetical protein